MIKSFGNITIAAKSLGCERATLYRWIGDDKQLNKAIQEGRDSLLDMAENKMAHKIKDGDTTALIFYLKTQGKTRGYTEKHEVENDHKGEIIITRKVIDPKE